MHPVIWSVPTRIIHWAIALPVLLNFFIEGGDFLHKFFGFLAAGAMVIRINWGLISKDKANFRYFPLKLSEVRRYISDLVQGREHIYQGHNPLASLAYVSIWLFVAALGLTGFMMGLDRYWGEEWLEDLHESLSNGLVLLILLHLFGIVFDGIKNKRKTWLGMITGERKNKK